MTTQQANQLSPSALLSLLPTLLPTPTPTLPSPPSALTALLHTLLTTLHFRLLSSSTPTPLSPPPTSNLLLPAWTTHDPESFTLLYKHPRSALTYLFKLVRLGDKLLIHARALEAPQTASVDLVIADWTSAAFFPWTAAAEEPLVHGFISSARVQDLTSLLRLSLISKVAPGLEKPEFESSSSSSSSPPAPSSSTPPPAPSPRNPPSRPYDLPPPPPPHPPSYYPQNPLSIGSSDLLPPGLPPSSPFAPPSLFNPDSAGMLVGPSHPIFASRLPPSNPNTDPRRWGGDGFLPPLGAPPGARWDPIGPPGGGLGGFGGLGGLRGGMGRGRGGGGGGRWAPGWGGEPDGDEFMPPGMEGDGEGGEMPPGMRDMFS